MDARRVEEPAGLEPRSVRSSRGCEAAVVRGEYVAVPPETLEGKPFSFVLCLSVILRDAFLSTSLEPSPSSSDY